MEILVMELLLAFGGDLATLITYLSELYDPATVAVITEDLHGF